MKKIYLILSCLCFYVTNSSIAQINIGGTPKSFQITFGAPVYYASNQLSSNRTITGTLTDVIFNGGDAVVMTEGFSVSGGAVFRATNTNCGPSAAAATSEIAETLPTRGSMVVPTENGTALYAGNGELISEDKWIEDRTATTNENTSSQSILTCQPNPFKGSTTLLFTLEKAGQVQLQLFDLRGKLMRTLINTTYQTAGEYTFEMASNTLSAGQYWAVLQTATKREVVKLVLIK